MLIYIYVQVHAGLFYDDVLVKEIMDFDRFHEIPPQETLMEDMLWSDPCDQPGTDFRTFGLSDLRTLESTFINIYI